MTRGSGKRDGVLKGSSLPRARGTSSPGFIFALREVYLPFGCQETAAGASTLQVMQTAALPCPAVKHQPAEADERQLAARVARGDDSALDEVIALYGRRVVALAARLLAWSDGAEDVAQDVFVAVLAKGKHFRAESNLWTWLAALTVNRCRSVRRRRWVQERVLRVIGLSAEVTESKQLERDEHAARVRAVVAELPAAAREVIVLRYFEELSMEEIATIVGAKRNAVEARLSRARKQLEPLPRPLADERST